MPANRTTTGVPTQTNPLLPKAQRHVQRCLRLLRNDLDRGPMRDMHERHLWYWYGFLDALSGVEP